MPWLIHRDTREQHWFPDFRRGSVCRDRSVCDGMWSHERVNTKTLAKWRELPAEQADQLRRAGGWAVWAPDTCERCWRIAYGALRMPFTDEARKKSAQEAQVVTCAQCGEQLALVELRCARVYGGVKTVKARYQCPNVCAVERTVADQVPWEGILWWLYRGARGGKRWHLWIEEREAPSGWTLPLMASACGCADLFAYPDRVLKSPTTRERVCQMCRCLADKFEIKLPKGALR